MFREEEERQWHLGVSIFQGLCYSNMLSSEGPDIATWIHQENGFSTASQLAWKDKDFHSEYLPFLFSSFCLAIAHNPWSTDTVWWLRGSNHVGKSLKALSTMQEKDKKGLNISLCTKHLNSCEKLPLLNLRLRYANLSSLLLATKNTPRTCAAYEEIHEEWQAPHNPWVNLRSSM